MKRRMVISVLGAVILAVPLQAAMEDKPLTFNPEKDLLSLHYDHAPDQDDGQSAAADRTVLESIHGRDWIAAHVLPVSGAYGMNKPLFNVESDAVMDTVWNERGGWVAAHRDRNAALETIYTRWLATLETGGDVYVKEGGQSDITAEVVRRLRSERPGIDPLQRIHVVQHSTWNENQTTAGALEYVKRNTHYIRIADANRYLNVKDGNAAFEKAATCHPLFGPGWRAAFAYYPPSQRLDFSDTGELLHILGVGEVGVDDFRKRFLDPKDHAALPP